MFNVIKEAFKPALLQFNFSLLFIVSFLAAATGPFGTFETHSFLQRLFYWTTVSFGSVVVGRVCRRMSRRIAPENRPVLRDLSMVGLMVLCFTPPLWFLTRNLAFTDPSLGPSLVKMGYYVCAISLCICVFRRVIPGFEKTGYFGPKSEQEPPSPRLVRRLSPDFAEPILRLSVRDHFVDVVSLTGHEAIRMRFADAIDEMDTVIGYCTHRSHWVARNAIVGVKRENGKICLELINGDLVPVSRKYKPELEAVGLL